MKKKRLAAIIFSALMMIASAAYPENNFRMQFADSYRQNRFDALAFLVKKNKDIIPAEVRSLTKEALEGDKTFNEKMNLLDLASAMASMYRHWHGDGSLVPEVDQVNKAEIKKEESRVTELTKWDKYEKFLGNFVMKDHQAGMDTKGLSPVIYPHWFHRLLFECKTCHQEIFVMKRGGNAISHDGMREGKLCAACHNGKLSFSSGENCGKCHTAGLPESERLRDLSKMDLNAIKEAAYRIGSVFNPDNLPGKSLPLDKFGHIDWAYLKEKKAYEPLKALDKGAIDEVRENAILFEPPMTYVKNVVFDHKTHSSQIKCATCHPAIFKDELGSNKVTMIEMSTGKYCGYCHGKVAFKFAECNRCHSKPPGDQTGGALIRKAK
ncbi:MAG: cytochrome c3 family protein [Deltaproteobacteria bacterium]|nr:cytochrome c3 family protein [Deltaproteobacteria bacterium]